MSITTLAATFAKYNTLPLPPELQTHVLQYLSPWELVICSLASKAMYPFCNDDLLWKRFYIERHSAFQSEQIENYKDALRQKTQTYANIGSKGDFEEKSFPNTLSTCDPVYCAMPQYNIPYIHELVVHRGKLFARNWREVLTVWDVTTGKLLKEIPLEFANLHGVHGITFASGKFFFGHNKQIRIWSWNEEDQTVTELSSLQGHEATVFRTALFGKTLFSLSCDQTVKMWDIESNKLLESFNFDVKIPQQIDENPILISHSRRTLEIDLNKNTSPCTALTFANEKLFIAIKNHGIKILDIKAKQWQQIEDNNEITALAVFNNQLVSGCSNGAIQIGDIQACEQLCSLRPPHVAKVQVICTAGKYLFSAAYDGKIKVWDMVAKKCLFEFVKQHRSPICALTYDKGNLFSADNNGVVRALNLNIDPSNPPPASKSTRFCTLF